VGGDAADFFGGEDGRGLQHFAVEGYCQRAEFGERLGEWLGVGGGRALGVEGVGGEAEADRSFVGFVGGGEELREPGVFAQKQREYAGCHGVERTEVADGALAGGAADNVDDIVGGHARSFIQYQ